MIRNEQNLGFSAANNIGIRNSRGRNILILNDDAILEEGALNLMFQRLESGPKIGCVGPKLLNPDGSLQASYTNRRFPRFLSIVCFLLHLDRLFEKTPFTRDLFTLDKDLEKSAEADHLAGACLLLRHGALDAVGDFDEGFHYLSEDADLCYRLKKAGWGIFYLAEARVTHFGSASIKRLDRSTRDPMFFRSMIRYFKKHSTPMGYFALRVTLSLVFALRVPVAFLLAIFRTSWTRRQRVDFAKAPLSTLRMVLFERPTP